MNQPTRRQFTTAMIFLGAAGPLAAQKASAKKEIATAAPARPVDLIWPMPPDPPRVRWLAEYADMAKVKKQVIKKQGWIDKLSGAKTAEDKLELRKPYGITTDKRGRIYVADTEAKTVRRFKVKG